MENIKEIEMENKDAILVKHIVVEHKDGSITTMLKSTYDAMQAEQSTPIVIDEAKTK
jgi:hypothetical protein